MAETDKAAPTRRERERERNREEILRAAEKVFAARGYEGSSMADIAAEAEFSVGSLYNFFRDKAALGEEVMVRICEERAAELEALAPLAADPAAGLREAARLFARHLAAHGAFLQMSFSLQSSRGHAKPPPRIETLLKRQRKALVSFFRKAAATGALRPLPPEDLAAAATGLCIQFAADWRMAGGDLGAVPERALADRIAGVLAALLLEGKGRR